MEWTKEAEEVIARVPFFVRKKVRAKVEEEAQRATSRIVTLDHVRNSQKRFLTNMEQEVKGFQLETCFGTTDCPNRAVEASGIPQKIEQILEQRDLKTFLKERVQGPLKIHHELRLSLSCCPNACSRPQIVDLGIIGAKKPKLTDDPCSQCRACVEVCKEEALTLEDGEEYPTVDMNKCLYCGQCIKVCPSGTLQVDQEGFRLLVGGKLGRHPQLGKDLGEIFSETELLSTLNDYLDLYQTHNQRGERLGEILTRLKEKGLESPKGHPAPQKEI
jgi:dissimilatory sulfite reductase (desulfoviridin) alpha/beta subunit